MGAVAERLISRLSASAEVELVAFLIAMPIHIQDHAGAVDLVWAVLEWLDLRHASVLPDLHAVWFPEPTNSMWSSRGEWSEQLVT